MLDYWRLNTKDNDFFLVKSPVLALTSEVRAYHLELLNRVRTIPNHWERENLIFEQFENYYSKIANLLNFNINILDESSRLSFFIAHEQKQDFWLSGLEIFMGYDFVSSSEKTKEVNITSGSFEIDLLAELLLLPDTKQVKWLYETKSPSELLKLIKQISLRSRGQEAVDDLTKQKDLAFLENSETMEALKKEGFGI